MTYHTLAVIISINVASDFFDFFRIVSENKMGLVVRLLFVSVGISNSQCQQQGKKQGQGFEFELGFMAQ